MENDENDFEVPEFALNGSRKNIVYPNFKKIIYAVSAACIIVLILMLNKKPGEEISIKTILNNSKEEYELILGEHRERYMRYKKYFIHCKS